jgi:hypothetical protein
VSSFSKKASALLFAALALTTVFVAISRLEITLAGAQTIAYTVDSPPITSDLGGLTQNPSQLKGANVVTWGVARFLASVYMFEDFWLQSQDNQSVKIPVRLAGVSKPTEGELIKVQGTIVYNDLEGGFFYLNASSFEQLKNVVVIGWDGVQREHLFELLNRAMLPNLQALIDRGSMVNVTVSDHRTDTKSGWTQILTGYRWYRTGVYSNWIWFNSIPKGYTIPERVEAQFGTSNVKTGFVTGKEEEMEVRDGARSTENGTYSHQAIYDHLPASLDFVNVGDRFAQDVGPLTLQFLQNSSNSHFFAFFHFGDPDAAGHNQNGGGENSLLYEQAIETCDTWLGRIVSKLNDLNLTQSTLIYVTADHGFDEGKYTHYNAPYSWLATNDGRVSRNGDEVDVAPTIYYGLGMWGNNFQPTLDGYPLQLSLPDGVEQHRQIVLNNFASMIKPTFTSPKNGVNVSGLVDINFNVSDIYLNAVTLIINNTLVSEGPWTWSQSKLVEANCSYRWDTTNTPPGTYEIRVFLFDEHGSTNGPEQGAITVNVVSPETPATQPSTVVPPVLVLPVPQSPPGSPLTPPVSPATPPPATPPVSQTPPVTPTPPVATTPSTPTENSSPSSNSNPLVEYSLGIVAAAVVTAIGLTGVSFSKRRKQP